LSITVFLADDHAIVRDGLRLLLESKPFIKVAGEADNGRDAARMILEKRPDIAVLDIAMPQLNGIEALRLIQKEHTPTKTIILSMYSTNEHIISAFDAGACGYLLKEAAGAEVIDAVMSVHAGNYYLCRKIKKRPIEDYIGCRRTHKKPTPLESLSRREREILQLVVEGNSSADIAGILLLSPKTIETYRCRLMQKLGITDIPGLVKFAIQLGLTPLK
jgi:DNA-binding NarL/FixJ family response regulator